MPTYSVNKKATFEYEILEKFEAGLILSGPEVKSVRNGNVKLTGAYITFHNNSAWLTNAHISAYKYAPKQESYDPTHSRKLLLHAKEIDYLRGKLSEKGLTIVPLSLYTKAHKIKIEIGLAKGKKTFDKREALKKKDLDKEMRQNMKKIA